MATRSSISMRLDDGSYIHAYCHNRGELEEMGPILELCWNDPEQIKAALSFKSLSEIDYDDASFHSDWEKIDPIKAFATNTICDRYLYKDSMWHYLPRRHYTYYGESEIAGKPKWDDFKYSTEEMDNAPWETLIGVLEPGLLYERCKSFSGSDLDVSISKGLLYSDRDNREKVADKLRALCDTFPSLILDVDRDMYHQLRWKEEGEARLSDASTILRLHDDKMTSFNFEPEEDGLHISVDYTDAIIIHYDYDTPYRFRHQRMQPLKYLLGHVISMLE